LIAWGAGVSLPNKINATGHDEFSQDWGLSHLQRMDVEQADIAPLMVTFFYYILNKTH
jgi:phosphatidylinositol glycan class N